MNRIARPSPGLVPGLVLFALTLACSRADEVVWARTGGPAPTATAAADAPDILVVLIDTLRPDHLSCYGYARETSPFLDRWAEDAALYEAAYTHGTHTRIAVASLFSGTLPTVHRVRRVDLASPESFEEGKTDGFATSLESWAESLLAAGYETWGLSSNPNVSDDFGFTQGFTRFWQTNSRDGVHMLETFLSAWKEREAARPDRPLFAYVHFMDPHNPYEPPEPFDEAFEVPHGERVYKNGPLEVSADDLAFTMSQYDGEILYLDGLLQRLLSTWEAEGTRERATVVLSDHGDEFQEHGGMGHGMTVYEELARTLLLAKGPGVESGRYEAPVAHVDVHRLVLDWAGAVSPEVARGRPWEAWGDGAALLYTESRPGDVALRSGSRTLVFPRDDFSAARYYERAHDPREQAALTDAAGLAELRRVLEAMVGGDAATAERLGTPARKLPADASVEELRALGYLGD